jgi:adenylate cyclase
LAELIVSAEGEALLETHRRQIAIVCCRLTGFPALAEIAAPEEVVGLLQEYHAAVGSIVFQYEGTAGTLSGDRLTIYFNDPLPTDNPAAQAVRMAVAMCSSVRELSGDWRRRGLDVELAVGIDLGFATLGTIGFEGKREYAAVGTVVHVAASLCDVANGGQVLTSQRIVSDLGDAVETRSLGERSLPGLVRPVHTYEVGQLRTENGETRRDSAPSGPLSAREREVVALIVKGYSNRQIAEELIIAEGTAVRHVANILNKLALRSRAQVAVWAVTHT